MKPLQTFTVHFSTCLFRDGRLLESDQILAINGTRVDTVMSHHEAISLLQTTTGEVELIVARGDMPIDDVESSGHPSSASSVSYNSDAIPPVRYSLFFSEFDNFDGDY